MGEQALVARARGDSSALGISALVFIATIAMAGVLLTIYFTTRMLMSVD